MLRKADLPETATDSQMTPNHDYAAMTITSTVTSNRGCCHSSPSLTEATSGLTKATSCIIPLKDYFGRATEC
jgi:hypothetical protein